MGCSCLHVTEHYNFSSSRVQATFFLFLCIFCTIEIIEYNTYSLMILDSTFDEKSKLLIRLIMIYFLDMPVQEN